MTTCVRSCDLVWPRS